MELALALADLGNTSSSAVTKMPRSSTSQHTDIRHQRQTEPAAAQSKSSRSLQRACESDGDKERETTPSTPSTHQRTRSNRRCSRDSTGAGTSVGSALTQSEARLERTRQLQNLRQRRYRARKKCSLSALQQRSQQLVADNARLERAIRAALSL